MARRDFTYVSIDIPLVKAVDRTVQNRFHKDEITGESKQKYSSRKQFIVTAIQRLLQNERPKDNKEVTS